MKWCLLLLIFLFVVFVSAYTPPSADSSIDLVLNESVAYTPPSADSSINLVFDLEIPANNTCTYVSGKWVMNCGDNCNISSLVNLGANDILINGTGTVWLSADVYTTGRVTVAGINSSNICTVKCVGGCFR